MKKMLAGAGLLLTQLAGAQNFTVTTLAPARNNEAIAVTAPVSVQFSQPVGSGALRVLSNQRGLLAGASTITGSTLRFAPTQPWQPGEVLNVVVPTSVHSSTGATLAQPQNYQLATAVAASTGVFAASGSVDLGPAAVQFVYPSEIVAGDIDNDGDQDLLTVNFTNPGSVSVRLNNGYGRFSGNTNLATGGYPHQLQLVDLDLDGDLDLLLGPTLTAGASVFLNTGNGTFGVGASLPVGAISGLLTGDLDSDGDVDLLTFNIGSQLLNTYLNNGAGSFSAGTQLLGGSTLTALADLDDDGTLDLLTDDPTPFTWRLLVRRGNGNGTFSSNSVAVPLGTNSLSVSDARARDLDGDGDLDLLLGTQAGIYLMRNTGSFTFAAKQLLPGSSGFFLGRVADVEGDGDPDLLAIGNNSVLAYANDGTGSFAAGRMLATAISLAALTTADVEGDGDLDLLTIGSTTRRASAWLNLNTTLPLHVTATVPTRHAGHVPAASSTVRVSFDQPLLAVPATLSALKVFRERHAVAAALITTLSGSTLQGTLSTGLLPGEKVAVSIAAGVSASGARLPTGQVVTFTAAAGIGPGIFGPGVALPASTTLGAQVIPADMDGDGDLDLCSLGPSAQAGGVNIFLNAGNGTFIPRPTLFTGQYPGGMAVADMNGDGSLDLVVTNGSTYASSLGKLTVYTNNGTGAFSASPPLEYGPEANGLTTGDIDGDGDLDIVALNYANSARVILNEGDGTYTLGSTLTLPISNIGLGATPSVYGVVLGDTDNDGDLDLLAYSLGGVCLSTNAGDGSFGTPTLLSSAIKGYLTTADVDRDGDLDLLTSNGASVGIFTNNGAGSFTAAPPVAVAGNSGIATVVTGDIDGDGDLDLISAGNDTNNLASVRLNNGAGQFSGSYSFPIVSSGGALVAALADLDGDGSLDLATANYFYTGASVFFNRVAPLATVAAPSGEQLTLSPNPGRQPVLHGARPHQPVVVLDAVGRVVFTTQTAADGTSQLSLPAQLASGLYLVRVNEQALRMLID